MCTPWASDRVVLVADWAGFGRFFGEWRICRARSPVRVPPRAQCFRRSEAFKPLTLLTVSTPCPRGPYDGWRSRRVCRWPFLWPGASFLLSATVCLATPRCRARVVST